MTAAELMPAAPAGFVACRVGGRNIQTTHLVALDDAGSNGGRPTLCGRTRFGEAADLPGWAMGNGGITGPRIVQVVCDACYAAAGTPVGLTCYLEHDVLVCAACGTRTGYPSVPAAQVAWSLHVLQEHWQQAGFTADRRAALLDEMREALK